MQEIVQEMECLAFETALGFTALARVEQTVHALSFGYTTKRAAANALRGRLGTDVPVDFLVNTGEDQLAWRLCEMALGCPTSFDDWAVDMSRRTPFQTRVVQACRAIPWGESRSYGQLAAAAGCPGAARAVGSVMASNRVPLIIPCHRVVLASGRAGEFSAPQGAVMRQRLLKIEQQPPVLAVS